MKRKPLRRKSLQQEVRKTRARLATAQQKGDRLAIVACIAELRGHAIRAHDEGTQGRFKSPAVKLLTELADKTEAELWRQVQS